MAKICYLLGKTSSARQKLLIKMMGESLGRGFLHIVPTKGRVMELETDPEFWIRRDINTLTGVIHRIFEEDIRPDKYADHFAIDRMVSEMLIMKAIQDRAGDSQGLAYFNALFTGDQENTEFTGICRNIVSFISTLYQNNYEDIYAGDLGGRIIREEAKRPGSSDERYALEGDLLWLMGDYEELKREIRGYDSDDIYKDVRDFLKGKNRPSCMKRHDIIILDSLAHITRIEEEILFYLAGISNELWWLIDYDSDGPDPITEFKQACGSEARRGVPAIKGEQGSCRAYYSLASLMDKLNESGAKETTFRAVDVPYPNPYAAIIYSDRDESTDCECNSLKIGAFATQTDEVKAIASRIKRILCNKGADGPVNPGDIRVIFPDLTSYAPIVFEIFTEYGLPFSLTKGIPLSSHPLSNLFLRIIELPIHGFKREDIFGLFSSAMIRPQFMGFKPPDFSLDLLSGDILLPGDTLDSVTPLLNKETTENLYNLNVHLFDTAMQRCGMERFGKRLEEISDERLSYFKDIYIAALSATKNREEKDGLKKEYYSFIRERILFKAMLGPFITLTEQETPEGIVEVYKEILTLLGFPANILSTGKGENGLAPEIKRGLLKRDVRAFTLLNELLVTSQNEVKLAQRLFETKKGDIAPIFFKSYRNRINNRSLLDERNPDVIRVSQWLETRGRSFDYLFAGGLISGSFPFRERPDFIIPEASRGIFRIIDPVDQSKQLFCSILKNYEKGLFLSYPLSISEKPVQPSQIIQDLCALVKNMDDKGISDVGMIWEAEKEYTSRTDMLDANKLKAGTNMNGTNEVLKNIIIRDSSNAEDIIRGIRSNGSRRATNGLFEYDGIVKDAGAFTDYIKDNRRVYSSSSLETLANCPMKYLFQYIYNIKDPDELTADTTMRDFGLITHEILSRFFKRLIGLDTNISSMGIERAFALAEEIIEQYINSTPDMGHLDFAEYFKQELTAGLTPEKDAGIREGIMASLIRFENDEFKNRAPHGVEYEFGSGETEVRIRDIGIKGYIDRFDRDTNSPDSFYIYDYKTGRIKPSSNIKKGLAFQLPFYIKALQSVNREAMISASFYALKRDAFIEKDVLKQQASTGGPSGGVDISGVTLIDEFVLKLARLIDKGLFHHSADGLTCEYCTYRYACYRNNRRMDFLVETPSGKAIYSGKMNLLMWQGVDEFRKEWKAIRQSMEKAETLKTPSARKRHIDAIMEFKNDLNQRKIGLPFTTGYIESLMVELDLFLYRNNQLNAEELIQVTS
ncbi:MAG: exodeoxyribonuclease V subunit gamma [Deltaproteobacteria bacterium]|nr:exodeoxyribonuclease V subunit gamma [Deltaproteobacteria bacterium]